MGSMASPQYKPLGDTGLFFPLRLGAANLAHRIIMGTLTRTRASKESDDIYVPNDLTVEYYRQRASSGGLQLTEACSISRYACGYPGVPGIFTDTQVAGWRRVINAVHAEGGFIYCQLWHVGKATVPSLLDGRTPVNSSDIPTSGILLDGFEYSATPPKPLTVQEIHEIAQEFASAAKRAMEAGFNGVEIHGANGYLLDQFLHDNVNRRTDEYGGSIDNRCRFPLEVIEAVTSAIGPERVGIRLSPYNYSQGARDSDPNNHWAYLCEKIIALDPRHRPCYVHMLESCVDNVPTEGPGITDSREGESGTGSTFSSDTNESLDQFRAILAKGNIKFLAGGNFNRDNAAAKIDSKAADAIVFGRYSLANPDLPRQLEEGLPLNPDDVSTFFDANPQEKGYMTHSSFTV